MEKPYKPKYKNLEQYNSVMPYTLRQTQYGDSISLKKVLYELDEISLHELPIDYSDFANFVFFASAQDIFISGKNKILTFPYNKSLIKQIEWKKEESGYEKYLLSELWPKYVGHCNFENSQYIKVGIPTTPSTSSYSVEIYAYVPSALSGSLQYHNIVKIYDKADDTKTIMMIFNGATNKIGCNFGEGGGVVQIVYQDNPFTHFDEWVYLRGEWNKDVTPNQLILSVHSSSFSAFTGLNNTSFNAIQLGSYSSDTFSGSLRELRFWTKSLSETEREQNWRRNIYATGSLNTYYRFNEGIFGNDDVDKIILDYSGNDHDALYNNYATNSREGFYVSGSKNTTVQPYDSFIEEPSPLLYENHSLIQALMTTQMEAALNYDNTNDTQLIKQVPEYYIVKDQEEDINILTPFLNGLGVLLDLVKTKIDYVKYFYNQHQRYKRSPGFLITALLKLLGWDQQHIFTNFDILQYIFPYEQDYNQPSFYSIKHEILYRLFSELTQIYKTKGTVPGLHHLFNVFTMPSFAYELATAHYKKKDYNKSKEHILLPDLNKRLLFQSGSNVIHLLDDNTQLTGSFTIVNNYLPSASADASGIYELTGLYNSVTGSLSRVLLQQSGSNNTKGKVLFYLDNDTYMFSSSLLPIFDRTLGNWSIFAGKDGNDIRLDIYNPLWDGFLYQEHITGSITGSISIMSGNLLTAGKYVAYDAFSMYLSHNFLKTGTFWSEEKRQNLALHLSEFDILNPDTSGYFILYSEVADVGGNITVTDKTTGSNFVPNQDNTKVFLETTLYPAYDIDVYTLSNKINIYNTQQFLNRIKDKNSFISQAEFNLILGHTKNLTRVTDFTEFYTYIASKLYSYNYQQNFESWLARKFKGTDGNIRASTWYDYLNFDNYIDMLKYADINMTSMTKKIIPAKSSNNEAALVIENPWYIRNKLYEKYTRIDRAAGYANSISYGNTNTESMKGSATSIAENSEDKIKENIT